MTSVGRASRPSPARVLFLAHDVPWPTVTGGRTRDAQIIPRALREASIDLVIVAREDGSNAHRSSLPALEGLTTHVFGDEAPRGAMPSRDSAAARGLIRRLSTAYDYDAVHVEGHYLLHLLPDELLDRVVLVEHNVESLLLRQRRDVGEPVGADELVRLHNREESAWRRAGSVVALTPEDAAVIRRRAPSAQLHLVPNGWDHVPALSDVSAQRRHIGRRPRLLFLANYAYHPNVDAVLWLVDEIFPRIRAHLPAARLTLAGANMPASLRAQLARVPGVVVRGYVADVRTELDQADVVVCPLRVGGGVKVKVIEAIRRAAALVSTSVGVQGVPAALRSAVCVADDGDDFAHRVVVLCLDPEERLRRRRQLAAAQDQVPTWDQSAAAVMRLWASARRPCRLAPS